MSQWHGEYKVPGGKLVVVDFATSGENITDFKLSGDFFLEPDSVLETINSAVNGLPTTSTITDIAAHIKKLLPQEAQLLGITAEAVGVAVRRALTGAAQWRDYDWQIINDDTAYHPLTNAALDEVLTSQVAAGKRGPTLRIWQSTQTAVFIGSFQSVANEVDVAAANARNIEIVRRISGGGAMYMVPENSITYALYVPESLVRGMSFEQSYAFLDEWVIEALQDLGINARYVPLNDIAGPAGKIGGAAQKRLGSGGILHHVTIAYDINGDEMTQVLRIGREKLSDKGIKSANKRVDPLKTQTGMTRREIIDSMVAVFKRRHGGKCSTVTDYELESAEKLVNSKFDTDAWRYRVS